MRVDRRSGIVIGIGQPTRGDIRTLMRDRPPKFQGRNVKFEKSANGQERCGGCWHFYASPVTSRGVCELVRPEGDGSIGESDWCNLWTSDGARYQNLKDGTSISPRDVLDRKRY